MTINSRTFWKASRKRRKEMVAGWLAFYGIERRAEDIPDDYVDESLMKDWIKQLSFEFSQLNQPAQPASSILVLNGADRCFLRAVGIVIPEDSTWPV
jgi:hypothetical protein